VITTLFALATLIAPPLPSPRCELSLENGLVDAAISEEASGDPGSALGHLGDVLALHPIRAEILKGRLAADWNELSAVLHQVPPPSALAAGVLASVAAQGLLEPARVPPVRDHRPRPVIGLGPDPSRPKVKEGPKRPVGDFPDPRNPLDQPRHSRQKTGNP